MFFNFIEYTASNVTAIMNYELESVQKRSWSVLSSCMKILILQKMTMEDELSQANILIDNLVNI